VTSNVQFSVPSVPLRMDWNGWNNTGKF